MWRFPSAELIGTLDEGMKKQLLVCAVTGAELLRRLRSPQLASLSPQAPVTRCPKVDAVPKDGQTTAVNHGRVKPFFQQLTAILPVERELLSLRLVRFDSVRMRGLRG